MRAFKVIAERVIDDIVIAKPGDTVYSYNSYDYGLVRDDEHFTGYAHEAVTHNSDGGAPFFTIPTVALEAA